MIGDKHLDRYQADQLRSSIVLPPELAVMVEINPHLMAPLTESIRKAVEVSFAHKDTAMRVISGNEITDRANICLQILEQAHAEQGFSLLQLIDALPTMLVDVLRQSTSGNDLLAAQHERGRWTTGDGDPEAVALAQADGIMDTRLLAGDPEGSDDVLAEDQDLTDGIPPKQDHEIPDEEES